MKSQESTLSWSSYRKTHSLTTPKTTNTGSILKKKMHIQALVGTALLAGGTLAYHMESPVGPRGKGPITWSRVDEYRWPMDLCGESTFEDKTNHDKSPLTADCEKVISELAAHDNSVVYGGGWAPDEENIEQYVGAHTAGTCTFGFRPQAYGSTYYKVGYTDIVDVMRDALARFGDGQRVGAAGRFDCVNDDSQRSPLGPTLWKIWDVNHP